MRLPYKCSVTPTISNEVIRILVTVLDPWIVPAPDLIAYQAIALILPTRWSHIPLAQSIPRSAQGNLRSPPSPANPVAVLGLNLPVILGTT